jgi:GxxExxY protein
LARGLRYYQIDFIVERQVVVEVKSVEHFHPIFDAQMLAYLRATGLHIGLLVNFNTHLLTEGVQRFVR